MALRADRPPTAHARVVAALVVLVNLGVFVLVAEALADGGRLLVRDEAVLSWFVDHRSDVTVRAAQLVSAVGGFVGLAILGTLLAVLLWRRCAPVLCVAPLAALIVASLSATTAKALFGRERPPVSLHAVTVSLDAFPSGHATDAAAFFLASALTICVVTAMRPRAKVATVIAGAVAAAAVGISRLVLAVHWLSDVVAGWALGTAIAVTVVMAAWIMVTETRPDR